MLKKKKQKTTELPSIKEVKIKLDALIRAKIDIEQSLKNDERLIKMHNSTQKGSEVPINMEETFRLYNLKLDQLLHFKEAIRNGNNNIIKDSKKTNDYYIYLLSNLNRRKALLLSLNTFEGSRPSFQNSSKKVTYVAHINLSKSKEEIANLESQIREIENILSDFNHSVEVEVLVYEELNLL